MLYSIFYLISKQVFQIRMINVFSSPDCSGNPTLFGAWIETESGSEAVMKNYRSAPKKKHQPFDHVFI